MQYPFADLKERIDKSIQDALDMAKTEVGERLEQMWEDTIRDFYDSYSPTWYRRTESTFKASEAYKNPGGYFFSPIDNTSAEMGIRISSDNIGNPYKADPEWVFTRTYELGRHGYQKMEAYTWARRKKNGVYIWSRPSLDRLNKMKVLRPSSKERMDSNFKKFKKNELKNILESCLGEALKKNL